MTSIKPLDINPKRSARASQNGANASAYFKNVCYGCHKPFNKSKGRWRSVPVVFAGGGQVAYLCGQCDKQLIGAKTAQKVAGPS